jgi:hypothetical protein
MRGDASMRRFQSFSLAILLAMALPSMAFGAGAGMPITQKAVTPHYDLSLQIGPMEKMYSKADAVKMHPTSGEVMTGGTMAMANNGMATGGSNASAGMGMEDTRHLEVHVTDRATGKVVTTAKIQITMMNDTTKMSKPVPVATMYGVKEGPSDWHYGNNVSMPSGSYTVTVSVNGERAAFHVTIP